MGPLHREDIGLLRGLLAPVGELIETGHRHARERALELREDIVKFVEFLGEVDIERMIAAGLTDLAQRMEAWPGGEIGHGGQAGRPVPRERQDDTGRGGDGDGGRREGGA